MNTVRFLIASILLLPLLTGCANSSKATDEGKEEVYQTDLSCSYFYFLWGTHAEYDQRFDEALEAFEKALICDPNAFHIEKKLPVLLFRLGETEKAANLLRASIVKNPEDISQYLLLAHLSIQQNDREEAIRLYREVLKREPDNEGVLLRLGILTVQQGHFKDAEKIFRDLIKQNPELYFARIYLARLHNMQGNLKAAAKAYEYALSLNWSPDLAFEMVDFYSANDREDDVLRILNSIISNDPTNERAIVNKIQLLLSMDRDQDALDELKALRQNQENGTRLDMAIAKILLRMGQLEEASSYLEQLRSSEVSSEANYLLALISFQKNNPSLALKYLKDIEPESDEYADSIYMQIRIMRTQGRHTQAIALLKEATNDPANKNPLFYALLSSIYQEQERIVEAVASITAGTLAFPDSEQLHFEHALLLEQTGMHDQALNAMLRVLELSPDHPEALNYIGYTWADKNINLDLAFQYISRAVELKPENGFIRDSLGWVYFRMGNYANALKELLQALKLEPQDPHIYDHLGDVYRALNRIEDARKAYTKGLEMFEDEQNKRSLINKINALSNN